MAIGNFNGFSSNGLGGGGGTTINVVANYSALPPANTVPNEFYWCENSQGTKWLPFSLGGTYYNSGLYYSNGVSWTFMETPYQATQAEVDTGTNNDKFVTPLTFNNSTQITTTKSTGIFTGGGLSIGTGGAGVATTFTIAAGTGQIVDNTVNPTTVTSVSWITKTDVAVTNILTQLVTFVAIDSGGNVIQSATDFTPVQMREYIVIGVVVHSNLTTVNAVNQAQIVAYNQGNQLTDLMYSIGLFNQSGNVFSANGANLKLNKSVGAIFRRGANYTTLTDNPHLVTTGALTQASLRMQNQTGAGSASTTDIDVANYDLAGVTTAISPATRFSVLRIFLFQSNLIAVQRGQSTYNSLAEAKASIQTEPYVTNDVLLANGLLRGFLCVRANCTDLTNASQAFFIEAGKFGGSSGVGGLSVSTLQNAYDNSSDPEIVTDSTRGAVTIKRGSAADTDDVFEILDGAGNQTVYIKGNGDTNLVAHRKYFAYDNVTASVTGTTDETVMRNIPIPAGSIGANGKLEIANHVFKTSSTSTGATARMYLSTVDTNLVGNTGTPASATLIGSLGILTPANAYAPFFRTLVNKNSESLNEIISPLQSLINNDANNANAVLTTLNIDTSVNLWLVETMQLANSTNVGFYNNTQLYIDKP
jgi:hypothetical protein